MKTNPATRTHRTLLAVASLLPALALGGCGVEAVGAAATAGALSATSAQQAQAQQKQIVDQFKTLQDAGAARAASAAD
jgi:hypothetical protein